MAKTFRGFKMRSTCCNRRGKKQKRNQDQRLAERFDRWNSGEYGGGGLWSEAVPMKQSKRQIKTALKKKRSQLKRSAYKVNLAELLKF